MNLTNHEDVLLSGIATAIGEPARTRILLSLLDGHARTSTELAAIAQVTPPTASAHLNRLTDTRLIRVAAQGRHRYYSLASPEVARVLERLSLLAGKTRKSFVPSTPPALRTARSCYDHLAGALAVALHDHFLRERWLLTSRGTGGYKLSRSGTAKLERWGLNLDEVRSRRRRFAYGCLDWSERRPHLAGALGAVLLNQALARKWVARELDSRALRLTRTGREGLLRDFGLRFELAVD